MADGRHLKNQISSITCYHYHHKLSWL